MHTHPMNFAVLQLILAVPVLYCGRNFFQGGFKSLFHGNPNMDSLVAIGSGCSFAYSLVMTFLISDDPSYVHNLYYESAAVVLTRCPGQVPGEPEYRRPKAPSPP